MFQHVKRLFSTRQNDDAVLEKDLQKLRDKVPVPVFWLFGKTQSGKSSLVKFLTGAEEAEIGQGFKPCTRFSRQYQFPTEDAPLLTFLDTRGLDEPGYDPAEEIARFDELAHVVVVTVRATDHAQQNVLTNLRKLRAAKPNRPVLLVLTCLHEAYPQQQHLQPYPWTADGDDWQPVLAEGQTLPAELEPLRTTLQEQSRRFAGLIDRAVAVDLTPPEEGFNDPEYGGERLRGVLVEMLPHAFRQTLLTLNEAMQELSDMYAARAVPHIVGYSVLAATAGAIPIPWVDLFIIPGIQTRMIYHLAELYGQPLSGRRFLELAGTLGLGMLVRQAVREVVKFIPFVGSVAGGALAGASTYALGKAFCFYYSAVHQGHVPKAEDLRKYYHEQFALAEKALRRVRTADESKAPSAGSE